MSVQVSGDKITFSDNSVLGSAWTGFKNRILNGDMRIDQRNAGASSTPTNGTYQLDRWQSVLTQSSKFTVQQNAGSVAPPAGFKNYLGATVGASANVTVGASDIFLLYQPIEGYNVADLGYGAAGASTVTLSFLVRSSLTGTFGGFLNNSGSSRTYPFSYTISAANTWEQKTVTIAGDTTGTWLSTNGFGLGVGFSLGSGSTYSGTANTWAGTAYYSVTGATNVISTNSATFYVTGIQLEKGNTATSFDYRPYGTELALCQRYYEVSPVQAGIGANILSALYSGATSWARWDYKVAKRNDATIAGGTGYVGAWSSTSAAYFNNNSGPWASTTAITASSEL